MYEPHDYCVLNIIIRVVRMIVRPLMKFTKIINDNNNNNNDIIKIKLN